MIVCCFPPHNHRLVACAALGACIEILMPSRKVTAPEPQTPNPNPHIGLVGPTHPHPHPHLHWARTFNLHSLRKQYLSIFIRSFIPPNLQSADEMASVLEAVGDQPCGERLGRDDFGQSLIGLAGRTNYTCLHSPNWVCLGLPAWPLLTVMQLVRYTGHFVRGVVV